MKRIIHPRIQAPEPGTDPEEPGTDPENPVTDPAEDAELEKLFDFELNDTGYSITGYKGSETTLEFPSAYNGKYVTAITTDAVPSNLVSITVPGTVKEIVTGFAGLNRNLKQVILGEGVEKIGIRAFMSCESLSSITIPSTVKTIGDNAFYGCYALKSIELPDGLVSVGDYVFIESGLESIVFNNPDTAIGEKIFKDCKSLKSVTLPDNLNKITPETFQGCSSLTDVDFPSKLEAINTDAFNGCSSLTDINLPDSVGYIHGRAFLDTAITNVTLPASIDQLFGNAFNPGTTFDTSKAEEFSVQDDLLIRTKSYETVVITATAEKDSITIPEGITRIDQVAFENYTDLKTIIMPESLQSIDAYAFSGCTALADITIPASLVSVGTDIFYGIPVATITFKGTQSDWQELASASETKNIADLPAGTTINCTDGTITI